MINCFMSGFIIFQKMIDKYFHVLLIDIVYINNTSLIGKIKLLRRQLMLDHKEGLLNMLNTHR